MAIASRLVIVEPDTVIRIADLTIACAPLQHDWPHGVSASSVTSSEGSQSRIVTGADAGDVQVMGRMSDIALSLPCDVLLSDQWPALVDRYLEYDTSAKPPRPIRINKQQALKASWQQTVSGARARARVRVLIAAIALVPQPVRVSSHRRQQTQA
jgi:hypothetical protein